MKPPSSSPRSLGIHGHRGSRGTHPENCLPAFQEALAAGADYIELDIQLSADEVPIVFHDPCITSKLCRDASGKIVDGILPLRAMTAAEITAFDCGNVAQKKFPGQQLAPGTHISTLEETLAWCAKSSPRLGVNIEMKVEATHPELIPDTDLFTDKTMALVEKYGLLSRTQFQSFDFRPLRYARKRFPSLRIACLFEDEADFAAEAAAIGANAVGPDFKLLTKDRIAACHSRGLKVIPWTVNEPADWERLVAMGVDGLITDYPRKLIQASR